MFVKLLTDNHLEFLSLKGGCRGSTYSTLVKMSNCWISRVAAQLSCVSGYPTVPPFRCIIQEGLLSVTSESMCTKYWLTACSSLPRKKCGYVN